jgi:hypothetical protein
MESCIHAVVSRREGVFKPFSLREKGGDEGKGLQMR